MITLASGGEKWTAFSTSSATRWVRSATALPSTASRSSTANTTRSRAPVSAMAARTTATRGTGRADAPRPLVDGEHPPVQVLGLGDGRPDDVDQRHRPAPGPGWLLARQHQQALGVAPGAGGPRGDAEQ